MNKLTQEDVIERFIKRHGKMYDYKLVNYTTMGTPVQIICEKHGIFEQKPLYHIKSGCPKCAGFGLTNDERINLFKEIHGDTYKYDKFIYDKAKTKSIITCRTHGDFLQTPDSHLRGYGCWECSVDYRAELQRSSTEEFIQKASVIHNNNYNYEFVEYVNNRTKVNIECVYHGIFKQTPDHHLSGEACPKCANVRRANSQRSNSDEFSGKANIVHNDKYNYTLVEYINNNTHVDIICNDHGIFKQTPSNHLAGCGCPKCYNRKLSQSTRIERLIQVHGKRYKYDHVIYTTSKEKIKIICETHGIFEQSYDNHLSGSTCPKCLGIGLTQEEKIEQFQEVHGDRYNYEFVEYINTRTKIKIECTEHGIFEQTPNHHLSGSGCPKCNYTLGEDTIARYLEQLNIDFMSQQRFEECRGDSKPLSFDFYLPDYDLLIEYDGIQHFEYCPDYFHRDGYHVFEQQQRYDQVKNDYAKQNAIPLLRIAYFEPTIETLENYLAKFL